LFYSSFEQNEKKRGLDKSLGRNWWVNWKKKLKISVYSPV
jgi:hypothetical protein